MTEYYSNINNDYNTHVGTGNRLSPFSAQQLQTLLSGLEAGGKQLASGDVVRIKGTCRVEPDGPVSSPFDNIKVAVICSSWETREPWRIRALPGAVDIRIQKLDSGDEKFVFEDGVFEKTKVEGERQLEFRNCYIAGDAVLSVDENIGFSGCTLSEAVIDLQTLSPESVANLELIFNDSVLESSFINARGPVSFKIELNYCNVSVPEFYVLKREKGNFSELKTSSSEPTFGISMTNKLPDFNDISRFTLECEKFSYSDTAGERREVWKDISIDEGFFNGRRQGPGAFNFERMIYADISNANIIRTGNGQKSRPFNYSQLRHFLAGIDTQTMPGAVQDGDTVFLRGTWRCEDEYGHEYLFSWVNADVVFDRWPGREPWKVYTPNRDGRLYIGMNPESTSSGSLAFRDGILHNLQVENIQNAIFRNCLIYNRAEAVLGHANSSGDASLNYYGCTFSEPDSQYFPNIVLKSIDTYTSTFYMYDCAFHGGTISDDGADAGDIYIDWSISDRSEGDLIDCPNSNINLDNNAFPSPHMMNWEQFPAVEAAGTNNIAYASYVDQAGNTVDQRSLIWSAHDYEEGIKGFKRLGPGGFKFPGGLAFTYIMLQADAGFPRKAILGRKGGFPFVSPGYRWDGEAGYAAEAEFEAGELFTSADFELNERAMPDSAADDIAPFPVMTKRPEMAADASALYFGLTGAQIAGTNQSVFLLLEENPLFVPELGGGIPESGVELAWQYYTSFNNQNGHWERLYVSDFTENFTRSQAVEFTLPSNAAVASLFGRTLFWVRAVLPEGMTARRLPVLLKGYYQNTVLAENRATVRNEVLAGSTGLPNQSYTLLNTPVESGQQIWVMENGSPFDKERDYIVSEEGEDAIEEQIDEDSGVCQQVLVRWHEVSDFIDSGPFSRHYIINRESGLIRFGDGVRGRIPDRGMDNLIAREYRWSGGVPGNVDQGDVIETRQTMPSVIRVENIEAGSGGGDAETAEDMVRKGPERIRHLKRSVASGDFQALAQEASTNVVRAVCLQATGPDGIYRPGALTLAVLTNDGGVRPMPAPHVIDAVTEQIWRVMSTVLTAAGAEKDGGREERGRNITVLPPNYIRVWIHTRVRFADDYSKPPDYTGVTESLQAFLHPLTGSPDNLGWRFNRNVFLGDVHNVIRSFPGVAAVSRTKLFAHQIRLKLPIVIISAAPLVERGPGVQLVVNETEYDEWAGYHFLLADNLEPNVEDDYMLVESFKEGDTISLMSPVLASTGLFEGCRALGRPWPIASGRAGAIRVVSEGESVVYADIDTEFLTPEPFLDIPASQVGESPDSGPLRMDYRIREGGELRLQCIRNFRPHAAGDDIPDNHGRYYDKIELPVKRITDSENNVYAREPREDKGEKGFHLMGRAPISSIRVELPLSSKEYMGRVKEMHWDVNFTVNVPLPPPKDILPISEYRDKVFLNGRDLPYPGDSLVSGWETEGSTETEG